MNYKIWTKIIELVLINGTDKLISTKNNLKKEKTEATKHQSSSIHYNKHYTTDVEIERRRK